MGKDLLYLKSSSGNDKGGKWLQSIVGSDYNVHVTDSIYRSSHIDSTLMALRPGLILVNSARATEKNLPKYLISGKRFILKKSHQHHQKSWTSRKKSEIQHMQNLRN